jgi:uncharacterized protein YdaU (DUF1376 family)
MSPAARGAYIMLLCRAWQGEPPATLPNDDAELAALSGMALADWLSVKSSVLRCFTLRNERLLNVRLEGEYLKFAEKREKASAAGRRSGESRRNQPLTTEQTFNERSTDVERSGSGSGSGSDNSSLKRKPDSKDAAVAYAVELGLPASDGESVWDKWQGNGFTNGGKPMKDWKAVLRSWKGYGYLPSQKQSKGQPNSRTKGTFNEGKASQYANGYS